MGSFMDKLQKQANKAKEMGPEREKSQNKAQREDFLLKQIEEFKDRARQIQNTIKEQRQASEKLAQSLNARIESVIAKIDGQPKQAGADMSQRMDALEEGIAQQLRDANGRSEKEFAEINAKIQSLSEEADKRIQEITGSMEEKVQGLAGHVEMSMEEKVQGLAGHVEASMEEKVQDLAGHVEASMEGQTEELKELLGKVSDGLTAVAAEAASGPEAVRKELVEKLEAMQIELGEKVHSENVKCYRNVQVLVEELEQKVDLIISGDGMMGAEKKYAGVQIGLAIINLIGIVIIVGRVLGFY